MKSTKISVVIPLYNKQAHIRDAICSVLEQSQAVDEIIVVDDGSTDKSVKLVEKMQQPKVKVVSQANAGVSAARNKGVAVAKNQLVAFLDADDVWLPMFVDEMLQLHDKYPNTGFYATRYQNRAGVGCFSDPKINLKLLFSQNYQAEGFLLQNYFEVAANGDLPFMVSGCMVNKQLFSRLGGFPIGEKIGEDQDFFAKVALQGDIAYSPNINLLYSVAAENKATEAYIPEQECPFSKRLNQYQQMTKLSSNLHQSISKYSAAHLCHLAKLNIKSGRYVTAKTLLNDPRCWMKPMHKILLNTWCVLSQFSQHFSAR